MFWPQDGFSSLERFFQSPSLHNYAAITDLFLFYGIVAAVCISVGLSLRKQ